MQPAVKRSVLYTFLIAALLLFAYCLRSVFHQHTNNSLLAISMMTLRWAIHITLTVIWIVSINRRILNTAIRRMLLSVGALLLIWQVVRIIKYDYVIITEPIGRYCWYAYYIAMVLVPLIGVFVVNHIGKPEGYRSPKWLRLLFIPAVFLIAVVFTNDLHQLVFTFHIDLKRGLLRVERAVTHPTRNEPHIKQPKTLASRRTLHLAPQIACYLTAGVPSHFVLGGETPLTYTQTVKMYSRIQRETQFEEKISPRRFRTTVLTDLYDTTRDIKLAQMSAGHTTAAMTLKHYVRGRNEEKNTALPVANLYGLTNY